jgi:ribosomal protein L7/L12
VDVYKKYQRSKKHIQHIRLPLEELWKKNVKEKKEPARTPVDGYLRRVNFPILFRENITNAFKNIRATSDGEAFWLTNDGSLLRLYKKGDIKNSKGWDLVYQNLPFKPDSWELGTSDQGHHLTLFFHYDTHKLLLLNISTGENKLIVFDQWQRSSSQSFIFDAGAFIHVNNNSAYKIIMDGSIEQVARSADEKLKSDTTSIDPIIKRSKSRLSILKNVERVFISSENELVFNIHALRLSQNVIKLTSSGGFPTKVACEKASDQQFLFPDGSTVEINRAGLFILKSSNPEIEEIFIPSIIDASLGVATVSQFAGNEYYCKEVSYKVMLHNAGPSALQIVKILKDFAGFGLAEAKAIVDSAPSCIQDKLDMAKASYLQTILQSQGALVEIIGSDTAHTEKILPFKFYSKNIQRYIETILTHGA